jgi:hypothetical protein
MLLRPDSLAQMPQFQQSMRAFAIKLEDLELDLSPFAAGAGGRVFKGSYGGTPVACKTIYSQEADDEREEFNREFRTLATLHHPNIITVSSQCLF